MSASDSLEKILIANRGEIAVRVIRTCRDMGIATVAVYSECDRNALHVRLADEACAIGPDQASESYLRVDKLIDVARLTGADAVHPGYGFLAENADFADACAQATLTFIGPTGEAMRAMGSKTSAREVAGRAGVPVVPGSDVAFAETVDDAELAAAADAVGYPLLVKAVAGGGGKGMRVVVRREALAGAVQTARSEASSSFGDGRVYFERRLVKPRHIEVQLLGDQQGTVAAFVERECSIQRRHQKLIEETPSPAVKPQLRDQLMSAAVSIGREGRYTSAGTVEFLVDASGRFYFLEMNTRLQVEHPITEAVTGLDFVRAQIEIAQGAKLEDILPPQYVVSGFTRTDVAAAGLLRSDPNGHAIEVRVYAEDPDEGFLPSPGLITHLRAASGPGIRDDSGAFEGWTVPTAYDPLISKVIAWAPTRSGAVSRMVRALTEYDIRGISTTIAFCRELIQSPPFVAGEFDTTTVDRLLEQRSPAAPRDDALEEIAAISAALYGAKAAAARDVSPAAADEAPAGDIEGTTGRVAQVAADSQPPILGRRPPRDSLWAQRARLEHLR